MPSYAHFVKINQTKFECKFIITFELKKHQKVQDNITVVKDQTNVSFFHPILHDFYEFPFN